MPATGPLPLLRHEARLQFGAPFLESKLDLVSVPFLVSKMHPRLKNASYLPRDKYSALTGHTLHLTCRPWSRQPILATAVCVLFRTNVNDSTKSATLTGEEPPCVGKFGHVFRPPKWTPANMGLGIQETLCSWWFTPFCPLGGLQLGWVLFGV